MRSFCCAKTSSKQRQCKVPHDVHEQQGFMLISRQKRDGASGCAGLGLISYSVPQRVKGLQLSGGLA